MKKTILIIILLIGLYSSRNMLNPKTYILSSLEIDKNITRQEYLGNGLGKVYRNRFGVVYFNNIYPRLAKFESNLFSGFGNVFFYMPLVGFLIYLGFEKYAEK